MSHQLTASSITDPQLEDLLAELVRLRAALALHVPDGHSYEPAVCRFCQAETWPCPTARIAAAPPLLIAPQSLGEDEPKAAHVIARQSLPEAP